MIKSYRNDVVCCEYVMQNRSRGNIDPSRHIVGVDPPVYAASLLRVPSNSFSRRLRRQNINVHLFTVSFAVNYTTDMVRVYTEMLYELYRVKLLHG